MNKYLITPIKQRFSSSFVDQDQMDKWIQNWSFFFVLGFGRSGTAFMANLLDKAPDAYVFHEPILEDFYAHARMHWNTDDGDRYIQSFRKREIYTRMRRIHSGIYGEVTSTIRCHAEAIKKTFSKVALIHLVRDGRDVVRSTFSKRTMTIKNPFSMSIHPDKSDYWYASWPDMDRFSRICWFWQEENRRLRKAVGKTVQFEKILSSYEYFASEILGPCGIHIEKKDWNIAIATPRNTTSKFSMPKWDDWAPDQKVPFGRYVGRKWRIMGTSINKANKYPLAQLI